MSAATENNWKSITFVSFVAMMVMVIISSATGLWVLTAIPVGFLFGFFLEKADLCGSSAFSEMIMMKDRQKFWAFA